VRVCLIAVPHAPCAFTWVLVDGSCAPSVSWWEGSAWHMGLPRKSPHCQQSLPGPLLLLQPVISRPRASVLWSMAAPLCHLSLCCCCILQAAILSGEQHHKLHDVLTLDVTPRSLGYAGVADKREWVG
jgi:hypothetical protein